MKPQTISTLEGIFVLDHDGFYVPYQEPERYSRPVSIAIALGVFAFTATAFIGAGYALGVLAG